MMDRIEQLLAFYREDPADPFTRFALAKEYQKTGATEEALAYYKGLVVDHPEYVGTYYHLGKLYEALGRTERAVETYRQGIAVAGRLRDAHARAELQDALLKAEGLGFEDEEDD